MLTSLLTALDAWCARTERRPGRWLALLAALLALQVGPVWYATPDGVAYLSIARTLAAGGPPANLGRPILSFPIGYPLLISPVFLAGARPLLLLSLAHWLLALVCMLGVFAWTRRQLAEAAPWVTALVMANVHIWILYRRTLSEAAFCALLPWTALAWNGVVARLDRALPRRRGAAAPSSDVAGGAHALVAVALLALLTAVREAGALVGVGAALATLAGADGRRARRRAWLLALAMSAAAALVFATLVRSERWAAASAEIAGGGLLTHLHLRLLDLGQLLIPGMFKAYDDGWVGVTTVVYLPLALLMAAAWWRFARRRADVLTWTVPPYLALLLAWPYSGGGRYLLPLLPVLWLALWTWCARLPHRRVLFATLALAHLGVAMGYLFVIDAPRARACHANWPAVDLVAARSRLRYEPLRVAAGVPDCVRLMLELTLDEPVEADGAADPAWLLLPSTAPLPEHYVEDAIAGDFILARRREPGTP